MIVDQAGGSLSDLGIVALGGFPQGVQGREADGFQGFGGFFPFLEVLTAHLLDQLGDGGSVRFLGRFLATLVWCWLLTAPCTSRDNQRRENEKPKEAGHGAPFFPVIKGCNFPVE